MTHGINVLDGYHSAIYEENVLHREIRLMFISFT